MTTSTKQLLSEDTVVEVDAQLADLIPGFMDNRWRDIKTIMNALTAGDYQAIQTVAHQMKGAGGGYGFDFISEAGCALEEAAKLGIVADIRQWVLDLSAYLTRVKVRYA